MGVRAGGAQDNGNRRETVVARNVECVCDVLLSERRLIGEVKWAYSIICPADD